MHFTARQIVNEFEGKFPETATQLAKLKGLGHYTAAAIASFAFGEAVAAIDGNVYRVMSRIFGIQSDMLSNEGKKEFAALAKELVSLDDPATYNQAMIEFGAIQCVPVSPDCKICPFNDICFAYEFKMQSQLPVKIKKLTVRHRFLHYFLIRKNDELAMRERLGKDIWKGLYDFYLMECKTAVNSPDDIGDDPILRILLQKGWISEIPRLYTHILTHQRLNVRFWWIDFQQGDTIDLPPGMAFYTKEQIEILPKPILIDTLLKEENYL